MTITLEQLRAKNAQNAITIINVDGDEFETHRLSMDQYLEYCDWARPIDETTVDGQIEMANRLIKLACPLFADVAPSDELTPRQLMTLLTTIQDLNGMGGGIGASEAETVKN